MNNFYQEFTDKFRRVERDCYYNFGERPKCFFISINLIEQFKLSLDEIKTMYFPVDISAAKNIQIMGYTVYKVLEPDIIECIPSKTSIKTYG